jgi:4-amino-4-deoxy-L-arabinose transferase-like glycosyltransferase
MKFRIRPWLIAPFTAFILACLLIPYPGLEGDECVFGMATFGGLARQFTVSIFRHRFPLMIFYYAGSLKGLLFWPILHLFGANIWSIRLPVALAGAVSAGLTYDFAHRIANRQVAIIAALLLATDPVFLLTNTFDWGPVAMEHVLLLSALALFTRSRLQLACFVLGLAFWNKAVFIWAFTGLVAGGLAAYWPAIRRNLPSARGIAKCAVAFLIGCAPLILYNIRQPASTLRSNVHMSFEGFQNKVVSLHYTLDGSDLFGIVAGMDGVTDHTGPRFNDLFLPALLISIAIAVWRIRSPELRPALFALAFCGGSLFMIAATKYTGFAHHIVLLYPMPQLLVAAAIASIHRKYAPEILAVLLVGANLLVFDTYITQLRRSGPFGLFTDATPALSKSLRDGIDHVYPIDAGLWENVFTMHEGKLQMQPLFILSQPLDGIEAALRDPRAVFVDHVPEREYLVGSAVRLGDIAKTMGFRRLATGTIYDSKGRQQIEVFRYSGDLPPAIVPPNTSR